MDIDATATETKQSQSKSQSQLEEWIIDEREYPDGGDTMCSTHSLGRDNISKFRDFMCTVGDYFVIWTFGVTDSFVRSAPLLMLISFINLFDYSGSQIVTFVVFIILYSIGWAFEFVILSKELIVARIDKETNWGKKYYQCHKKIYLLIYSFYSVISNALYLMVLIKVPYLRHRVTNLKYFNKYQLIRIGASVAILVMLFDREGVLGRSSKTDP